MSTGNLRLAQWLPRDLPLVGDTVAVTLPDPLETEFTTAAFPEAPIDSRQYGRQNEGWTLVPPVPFASDAPSDGNRYGRRNAAWSVIPNPEPDAPADGKDYARRNNAWMNLDAYATDAEVAAAIAANAIPDAPNDGKLYGRKNLAWAQTSTVMEAPVNGKQYARKDADWVETAASSVWIGDVPPVDPVKFPLWWDSTNLRLFIWFNDGTSTQWVDTNADPDELRATFVPEAPNDGKAYVRKALGWVDAGLAYVAKAGDTMTGNLAIQTPANADAIVTLDRATAAGFTSSIIGKVAGANRWNLQLGNGTAAADFSIYRYNDAGVLVEPAFSIARGSGWGTFTQPFFVGNGTGPSTLTLNGSAANGKDIVGQNAGVPRWLLRLGSSGAADDFALYRYNDAGAGVDAPITIPRATGIVSISKGLVSSQGLFVRPDFAFGLWESGVMRYLSYGSSGTWTWQWNGSNGTLEWCGPSAGTSSIWINGGGQQFGSNMGSNLKPGGGPWDNSLSDVRTKQNVNDYAIGLDELIRLRPVEYNYLDLPGFDPSMRYTGLVAQEVQEVVPSMVVPAADYVRKQVGMDDLMTVKADGLTYALINAVKTLHARIAVLEGAPA